MSNGQTGPLKLIRLEETGRVVGPIRDDVVRAFVKYGLSVIITQRGLNTAVVPQCDFDLVYFAETLRAIGENRDDLLLILQGRASELAWWPDERAD